jgi:broad specificity phosphatase PhoE
MIMVESLTLARHAESEYNVLGLLNGDPSVPCHLTSRGRDQALRLGRLLAHEVIDLCVTTDFPRTQETAEIALAGRDIPHIIMPELNDPPNGRLEGRPYEEHRRWRQAHGPDTPIPGSVETERQHLERLYRGVKLLLGRPERHLLVIAHGMAIEWVARSSMRRDEPLEIGLAQPIRVDLDGLRQAFSDLDRDVCAFFAAKPS